MARGNGKKETVGQQGWTRFVDISLAGVTKADIDGEFGSPTSVADGVDALLRAGYRIGISYNGGNHSFVVSLTCRDDGSPNVGCTVTSHAGDWWTALAVMLYKHFVVAREVWLADTAGGSSDSFG